MYSRTLHQASITRVPDLPEQATLDWFDPIWSATQPSATLAGSERFAGVLDTITSIRQVFRMPSVRIYPMEYRVNQGPTYSLRIRKSSQIQPCGPMEVCLGIICADLIVSISISLLPR